MSSYRIKRMMALSISLLPTSRLRMLFYSALMGYRFGARNRLGWQVQIAVESFVAGDDVTIRRGNRFIGPIRVNLGDRTLLGINNLIECGEAAAHPKSALMGYARSFKTGINSLIHEDHRFDVYGAISIGDGTWVAGFASQFLTHGASTMNRDISIGSQCYLGSAVRFSPGAGVADRVVVGMGAVVTKHIEQPDVVVGGVPAKVISERTADDKFVFEKNWT